MNKKSRYMFFALFFMIAITAIEVFYLYQSKSLNSKDIEDKNILVSALELPDLAISTEAMFIRHRSLSEYLCNYSKKIHS